MVFTNYYDHMMRFMKPQGDQNDWHSRPPGIPVKMLLGILGDNFL